MKLIIAIITIGLALGTAAIAGPVELEGAPRSLADGDTYVLHFRSQGIDTPEKAQQCARSDGSCYACGQAATAALDNLIRAPAGSRVKYRELRFRVWTVGTYGRPVVTAYLGDIDLHLELVRQGWAVAYRRYLPDELRMAYLAAEDEAKAAKRGMWQGEFIEPRLWRRGERLACE